MNRVFTHPATILAPALTLVLTLLLTIPRLSADSVTLAGEDQLSGTITSISDGIISIQSPISNDILEVDQHHFRQILFDHATPNKTNHSEFISLKNGDTLPLDVLSLDDQQLIAKVAFGDTITIPRASLSTLKFNLGSESSVLENTPNLANWHIDSGKWSTKINTFETEGIGKITRKLPLPTNLNISFEVEWEEKLHFHLNFCAEGKEKTLKPSGYHMVLNQQSLRIERAQADADGNTEILAANIDAKETANSKARISISINRSSGEINAMINNRFLGTGYDIAQPAQGSQVSLFNRSGNIARITDLKITKASTHNTFSAPTAKSLAGRDSLIDSQANQINGEIQAISKDADSTKLKVAFKADDHNGRILNIPEHRINTLYFRKTDEETPAKDKSSKVTIAGKGSLHLENIQFSAKTMSGKHPYLGEITIDKNSIESIEPSLTDTP